MIRSMTGYGEAERDSAAGRLRLEVKTVNHRFFNADIKTPTGFDRYEAVITEALKRHLSRGRVNAYLSVDRSTAEVVPRVEPDLEMARAYLDALEAVRDELNVPGAVDLQMLAPYAGLLRMTEGERAAGIEPELLSDLTDAAARAARDLREAEGERLEDDLTARLDAVGAQLDVIEARAPERLVEYRERLRDAVQELAEQVEVDEERLAREIAYLAERWDINEEVVRSRSHVELFREALASDGSEPVGKRLAFLTQELQREANTIGSKANDADVSRAAVALKEEIERIREQVENVE